MKAGFYKGLFVFLFPMLLSAAPPFDAPDFATAKARAATENKMILVYFTGEWCAPCKWMNGTTFADAVVQTAMADKFISLKSDIDTPEGFLLRNTFGVKYLPTLLVFNSNGQLLQKTEETVSPRGMLELIELCKAKMLKNMQDHKLNTAPSIAEKTEDTDASGDKLRPYRVQVGVFTRYDGAGDMVQLLRQSIEEPINVITESKDDAVLFRVQVGRFASMKEAEQLKIKIKSDMNLDGIVRHVM